MNTAKVGDITYSRDGAGYVTVGVVIGVEGDFVTHAYMLVSPHGRMVSCYTNAPVVGRQIIPAPEDERSLNAVLDC